LLSLDLSSKKPYQLHGLSNTMPNASNTKNLNLSNTEESYKGSETLKSMTLYFLHQYYLICDSGDRYVLLGAYHHRAYFSLTIPFYPEDPAPSSLCEYFKDSRNMKKHKELVSGS
ncbi:hypothetical protein EI555_013029, partial [Monodon monoceros]